MASQQLLRHPRTVEIPPYLRPVLRAYVLSYATTTGPRLFGFLRVIVRKDISLGQKLRTLHNILRTSLEPTRFPAAATLIVCGATVFPRLVKNVLQWLLKSLGNGSITTLGSKALSRIRFITTFLSAWVAFNLLNTNQEWTRRRARSIATRRVANNEDPSQHQFRLPPPTVKWSGKTIDFTLFALSRAIDTTVHGLWASTKASPHHAMRRFPGIASSLQSMADPFVFTSSAAIIMYAWFYAPERLPKGYASWISAAAQIDNRLIQVLRLCRQGLFVYGQDTGQAHLLGGMSADLGLPESMGDPKITIPVPCLLVHSGLTPSCEYHAFLRWMKSFLFAINFYVPLQLLTRIRPLLKTKDAYARFRIVMSVLKSGARTSSFLATFISLFYYTVCVSRTRIPQLYTFFKSRPLSRRNHSSKPISINTRQRIDGGICVITACMTCGLSILAESPAKRPEIAQFVMPRALATLLPRVYDARHAWKERVVFASSVAVVLTSLMAEGNHVRGVFGNLLGQVLKEG